MTLGNVGRASYSDFTGKRKLLIIPFVTPTRDDPTLHEMISTYWEDAFNQVRRLEAGFGEVRHLFHEGSVGGDQESVDLLEHGNPHGYKHLKKAIEGGAQLEPTEDIEALKETLDLHRCMSVVQASRSVADRLLAWFDESRKKRYEHIAKQIEERIEENGVGVLVISPDHEVQFSGSVEVVYVVPPILDRINVWMRDHPLTSEGTDIPPADDETPSWAKPE